MIHILCKLGIAATILAVGMTCDKKERLYYRIDWPKIKMSQTKQNNALPGSDGGSWTEDTHKSLYDGNLNTGLGDFIVEQLNPIDMLEFGSGVCSLANYLAERLDLAPSYCIEPEISVGVGRNLHLLNVDVLSKPAPKVLDKRFDLVLSIEVAEHIELEYHEALFDFLISRADRWIVFSGARPGQGGHGHVAERPELEWREEFVSRGCTFDPRLSAQARTYCNQKNINHRQNIQIFRAPPRSSELLRLEEQARPYLDGLVTTILTNTSYMTGGLFYVDIDGAISGRPEHSLHWKRENLCALAQNANKILEIGFAGGHSALIFLLANPNASITVVDPITLPYAKPCYDYLDRVFPGRMRLKKGLSTDVLPALKDQPGQCFDLVHLDGGKELTIENDLEAIRSLVATDHVIVVDDTQNTTLEKVVNDFETQGYLDSQAFRNMNARSEHVRWTHRIYRYSHDVQRASKILEEMQEIYRQGDFPSIYTAIGADGRIKGWNRAVGLIQAIRDVENLGISGAFVEIGVAAGHSSVIAALASSKYIHRDFYLYDTFSGFAADLPNELDLKGVPIQEYDLSRYRGDACSKPVVQQRMLATGLPRDRVMMLQGPAEETLPRIQPEKISILRLDADLFAPTYSALNYLYDRLQPGGYLIVDDYGHWKGCKGATDQFFSERGISFDGNAWDYTCHWVRK